MTDTFGDAVSRWQGFYTLAGAASATLVGLLFVAVSLHLDLFTQAESRIRASAEQTLNNFLYTLIVGLVFNIPRPSPVGIGVPLVIFALVGLGRTLYAIYSQIQENRQAGQAPMPTSIRYLVWAVGLPLLSHSSMLVVAVAVLRGNADALYWLVWVIITLLVVATNNAWNLLVRLSTFRKWQASHKAGTPPPAQSINP